VNSFDRLTQEPIEFIDAGDDQVLVEFIQRGWTAGSDVPVELRTWGLSTVRDGRFLRTLLFQNRKAIFKLTGEGISVWRNVRKEQRRAVKLAEAAEVQPN